MFCFFWRGKCKMDPSQFWFPDVCCEAELPAPSVQRVFLIVAHRNYKFIFHHIGHKNPSHHSEWFQTFLGFSIPIFIYIYIYKFFFSDLQQMTSDVLVLGGDHLVPLDDSTIHRPWAPWKRPKNFWKLLDILIVWLLDISSNMVLLLFHGLQNGVVYILNILLYICVCVCLEIYVFDMRHCCEFVRIYACYKG